MPSPSHRIVRFSAPPAGTDQAIGADQTDRSDTTTSVQTPPLTPALISAAECRSLDDRIAIKTVRIDAARILLGDSLQYLNVETAARKLASFCALLNSFKEPHAGRLRKTIESIANPTPEPLEQNGLFARRARLSSLSPELRHQFNQISRDRYWVDCDGETCFGKFWDHQSGVPHRHPELNDNVYTSGNPSVSDLRELHRLMMLLDPEVQGLVNQVPLPPNSPERSEIRAHLTDTNEMGFGDDLLVHRSKAPIRGGVLLPQRILDDLGFRGQFGLRSSNAPWRQTARVFPGRPALGECGRI